jgi:hypothetical protein
MDITEALVLLQAGEWEAAHPIVQDDESALGAWAHGIVHMLEGDRANAGYWYRRAGRQLPGEGEAAAEIEALAAAVKSDAG